MTWWQAAILGLVEGITEFLPVSSTGHLIITTALLGLDRGEHAQAVDRLNVVIQGGALLAIVLLYRERLAQLLRGVSGRDRRGLRLLVNLGVAFVPAAVCGVLFDDLIEAELFRLGPVVLALAVGGVAMIAADRALRRRPGEPRHIDDLRVGHAAVIGLMQCLALWPGTSRSMVTILGGLIVGLGAVEAAEFSFLLGIPTLGGASAYKLLQDLRQSAATGRPNLFVELGPGATAVGLLVAAAAAVLAVRWLVAFLGRKGLAPFGWYRLGLAAAVAALGAAGWLAL